MMKILAGLKVWVLYAYPWGGLWLIRGGNSLTCINFSEDVGDLSGSVSRRRSFCANKIGVAKAIG
jgi:hypothetical protein